MVNVAFTGSFVFNFNTFTAKPSKSEVWNAALSFRFEVLWSVARSCIDRMTISVKRQPYYAATSEAYKLCVLVILMSPRGEHRNKQTYLCAQRDAGDLRLSLSMTVSSLKPLRSSTSAEGGELIVCSVIKYTLMTMVGRAATGHRTVT